MGKHEDKAVFVEELFEESELELIKEKREAAKLIIKDKMKEYRAAKKVLANIERELDDLKLEIADEL